MGRLCRDRHHATCADVQFIFGDLQDGGAGEDEQDLLGAVGVAGEPTPRVELEVDQRAVPGASRRTLLACGTGAIAVMSRMSVVSSTRITATTGGGARPGTWRLGRRRVTVAVNRFL
jgi:hypothetical protein